MDYSMLLDVEQITSQAQNATRLENLRRSEWKSYDNTMIYHIGIIDFLQLWTIAKKMENYYKTKMQLAPHSHVSCASPRIYKHRFLNFIKCEMLNKHKLDSRKIHLTYNKKLFDYENFMNVYYSKYIMEDNKAAHKKKDVQEQISP